MVWVTNGRKEGTIYETDVEPRIQRMRTRIHEYGKKKGVIYTAKNLQSNEKTTDATRICEHALFRLQEIEKIAGSGGAIRIRVHIGGGALGFMSLVDILQVECMLVPLGLYSIQEIAGKVRLQ